MNFFEHQDKARKHTRLLLILFVIAVVCVVVAVNLALLFIASFSSYRISGADLQKFIFICSAAVIATIVLGCFYKFYVLSSGGISVALAMGGKVIDRQTEDANERRLLNIVEEMAIASGMPVPEVFVLERENGLNAFAAGFNIQDATITVTRGTLLTMSRDELQGIIAHEFSHILNGDMRLNMRLLGLISGISILAIAGRSMMRLTPRRTSSRKGGGGQIAVLGFALWLVGSVGVLFGRLIQAAISRQREYLADASAVQFTRNPDGIGMALKKIGGWASGSLVANEQAPEVAHFFFSSIKLSTLSGIHSVGWLSTHPPLIRRIKNIDPHFDGKFTEVAPLPPLEPAKSQLTDYDRKVLAKSMQDPKEHFIASIETAGVLGVAAVAQAKAFLQSLPSKIKEMARNTYDSQIVFFCFFLDERPEYKSAQTEILKKRISPDLLKKVLELHSEVKSLPDENQLSLLHLCLPSLRNYSKDQFNELTETLRLLCEADQRLTIKEYVSYKLIKLERASSRLTQKTIKYNSIASLKDQISTLLSCLAYAGEGQNVLSANAFCEGTRYLNLKTFTPKSQAECGLDALDKALDHLALASPQIKKQILEAAKKTVVWDRKLNSSEFALIHMTAAALSVPLPPLTF